jgi:DNA primase RepB-like protein/CHC2-type zinc finger protein
VSAIPQRLALSLQLAAIVGRERSGYLEIRAKTATGMRQEFVPVDQPAIDTILRLAETTDVYVGAAVRTERRGTRDAVAPRIWCLWLDVDGPAALERLRAFEPRPHMVIRSGSPDSAHAWWDLREPVTPEVAEASMRRLAVHLGADVVCADAARIMRPAGTLNHKHSPPVPVECVLLDVDRALTVGELLADVPEITPPVSPSATEDRQERPAANRAGAGKVERLMALSSTFYVPRLTGQELGRDNKICCPFHDDRTPSLHCYREPERGWACFAGCGAGSIIDLGALLFGVEPRGESYWRIVERLDAALFNSGEIA